MTRNMTGRDLSERLCYAGMERAVRKLAIDNKLAPVEKIAIMSQLEVCELIAKKYEMVYVEEEHIGLVPKEKMAEYNSLVHVISR